MRDKGKSSAQRSFPIHRCSHLQGILLPCTLRHKFPQLVFSCCWRFASDWSCGVLRILKSSINVSHALISLLSRSLNEIAARVRCHGSVELEFVAILWLLLLLCAVAAAFFWLCKYVLCFWPFLFGILFGLQPTGGGVKILFNEPQHTAYAYCVGSRRRRISYYCLPRGSFVCPEWNLKRANFMVTHNYNLMGCPNWIWSSWGPNAQRVRNEGLGWHFCCYMIDS